MSPDGTETVLYAFKHHADGEGVSPGLVADAEGNLYGATVYGGENQAGVVFRVSPDGRIATLYTFPASGEDERPERPYGRLIIDRQGNLIGTTLYGGSSNCTLGCGTIFKVRN